ncbi:MAG TPA: glutaredoxin [Candidatus Gracilibacteria bacterium]|nr:glutaredoxin [Candidatus Gracilibacteria bacterium]
MLKKIISSLLFLSIFIFSNFAVQADSLGKNEKVNIYFFWGQGCPHCAKEKSFLQKMQEKYAEIELHDYEVWGNSENRNLMVEFGKRLKASVNGVPFTVIGEKYIVGWMDEANTGTQIEEVIKCALTQNCADLGEDIIKGNQNVNKTVAEKESQIPPVLTLPLLGEIKTKNISLPVLTIIIAALDGFNPCAMWTLLFLISLLLGMQDRRRMWLLGSAFILSSAVVYFLFLAAWLNLLLFIGFILIVRILIAGVALGGGSYYLKEYFLNPHSTCVVSGSKRRQRVFEKLKKLTHEKHFLIALIGIVLLAVAVNLVELICSAGLSAVYTQILSLSRLSIWQYYGYLILYILVFMIDDLLVFFTAMITLRITGLSEKYSRISHLIGGFAMILIGVLLLFKPELLMFG